MANVTTTVTATGDYVYGIDSDNNSSSDSFIVDHGAGGSLFRVDEDATTTIFGIVTADSDVDVQGDGTGITNLFTFKSGSSTVAVIDAHGVGDFSTGGVRIPVVTTDPNGSLAGDPGDIVLFNDSGTYHICVNTGSSTAWSKSTALV